MKWKKLRRGDVIGWPGETHLVLADATFSNGLSTCRLLHLESGQLITDERPAESRMAHSNCKLLFRDGQTAEGE